MKNVYDNQTKRSQAHRKSHTVSGVSRSKTSIVPKEGKNLYKKTVRKG